MSDRYPPEPWYTIRYENVHYSHKDNVDIEHSGNGTAISDINKDLADRITVCINACSGVSSAELVEGRAQVVRNIPTREQAEAEYQMKKLERADTMLSRALSPPHG